MELDIAFLEAVVAHDAHLEVFELLWHRHASNLHVVVRLEQLRVNHALLAQRTRYIRATIFVEAFGMHGVTTPQEVSASAR